MARHKESPQAIRAAVEILVESKKYDHAAGLLKAAIRQGLGEPWMYEALAIVQEALGEDKQEIERTLLSAADVTSGSPDDQYRVARMLAAHKLNEAAIRLYREASEKVPLAPEPYSESLDLATAISDVATVRWAATHILSQGWVGIQDELYRKARNSTTEMARRLRAGGQTSEADGLLDAVRRVDNRDLIIRVSWQGEADVDIQVLEPLGTVCSAQNRMTPAGGVLVKDGFGRDAGIDKNPPELYVCARALAGPYEIRLHHVWGNPVGGRVKVEVTLHEGTDHEKRETHYVALASTKPLVVNLETGRRTQLLAMSQFVPPPTTAAEAKLPFQQLMDLLQSQVGERFGGPQQLFQFGGGGVVRGGAVAFQPTIEQFFNGAGLGVQAVVSADRRYVRLNLVPIFQQIARVDTFRVPAAVGGGGR